jgi:GNAT superfamily N-acetyltransferase
MPISIRLARLEDIPALQHLIPESVRSLSASYYNPHQIESALTYIFGVDTQLILDKTYFVAEAEGQIVGCGGWSKRALLFGGDQWKSDEDVKLLEPGKDPARIRAFYVHPRWSRKGIGRQIISACEDAARASGFTRLELVATLPGQPLYSASGYSIAEPVAVTLADGQLFSGFRMEKSLD